MCNYEINVSPGFGSFWSSLATAAAPQPPFTLNLIYFGLRKRAAVILFQNTPVMPWGMICHCYSVLAHLHLKHDPSGF